MKDYIYRVIIGCETLDQLTTSHNWITNLYYNKTLNLDDYEYFHRLIINWIRIIGARNCLYEYSNKLGEIQSCLVNRQ